MNDLNARNIRALGATVEDMKANAEKLRLRMEALDRMVQTIGSRLDAVEIALHVERTARMGTGPTTRGG